MRDRKRWPVRYPPGEALLALHRRRGPVINAGIAGLGYTHLLGPQANKFIFANAAAFSWLRTCLGPELIRTLTHGAAGQRIDSKFPGLLMRRLIPKLTRRRPKVPTNGSPVRQRLLRACATPG